MAGERETEVELQEAKRKATLEKVIARAPKPTDNVNGWLHLFAQPVFRTPDLVETAKHACDGDLWDELIMGAREAGAFLGNYVPDIRRAAPRPTVEGETFYMGERPERDERRPGSVLDLTVNDAGWMELHCGKAAARVDRGGLDILEVIVAGLALKFCAIAGGLYSQAGYRGQVDLGVGITGIQDAEPYRTKRNMSIWLDPPGFQQSQYLRTHRAEAVALASEPRVIARHLLKPFFRGLTQGHYDPLDEPEG